MLKRIRIIGKYFYIRHVEPRMVVQLKVRELTSRALHNTETGVAKNSTNKMNLILSLTSYGKRIFDVYLAIESLMEQTLKANKIILWLSEEEFNDNNIPLILKRQQERGLEIGYCRDIRSYKKLIPTLKKYPDDIIITADDDIIYPHDMIENLYRAYLETPDCVSCYRCHKMTFGNKGNLRPYKMWVEDYKGTEKSLITLPTNGAGSLFPPNCFHPDVIRTDIFTQLAPTADDVWFKAMTLLNNVSSKQVTFGENYLPLPDIKLEGLAAINNGMRQNDIQIKQVFDYYNLWDKLKSK